MTSSTLAGPSDNFSNNLCYISFPLLQCEYSVKNSVDFANEFAILLVMIQNAFSFHVVSLFRSVTVSLAIDLISLLCNDTSLHDRTKITGNNISQALNLDVKSFVFSFENILIR